MKAEVVEAVAVLEVVLLPLHQEELEGDDLQDEVVHEVVVADYDDDSEYLRIFLTRPLVDVELVFWRSEFSYSSRYQIAIVFFYLPLLPVAFFSSLLQ